MFISCLDVCSNPFVVHPERKNHERNSYVRTNAGAGGSPHARRIVTFDMHDLSGLSSIWVTEWLHDSPPKRHDLNGHRLKTRLFACLVDRPQQV
jgi:hypothetical protein